MPIVSVNVRAALLYLFVLVLVYLAGIYINPLYYYLYIFMMLFPIFSALQVVFALVSLRCTQAFDTDRPVKGGTVGYHLRVRGSRFFATGGVHIRFAPIHPRLPERIPDITLTFSGGSSIEEFYSIRCRYRGSYTIGIESLEIRDVLGWLTVRKVSARKTFYVYPRIAKISTPPAGRVGAVSSLSTNGAGGERDYAMIEGLDTYREGSSIKDIAWKKYLTTGVPFLKHFGHSAEPNISIYIDLRQRGFESHRELETEDCSIEAAVALVKGFLDQGVPVTVDARGEVGYRFEGSDPAAFAAFYRTTPDLMFHPDAVSPLELIASKTRGSETAGPILILTHLA
ncbi:MAG TPA: DUF58 domain-containing protein, partial [Spirochaetia bacterium]|nr:DUF58 domain-containing protein [Spirochaetia bacterium]